MDNRLTKKRLNDHLSYDWWKYIALIAGCIFFWSLVFSIIEPRLASSKRLEIFFIVNRYYDGNSEKLMKGLKEYLTDEIVEINFQNYQPDQDVTLQVLQARLGVQEGDLYVFPFSEEENDLFGIYTDNGIFADFETLIDEALAFGDISFEDFKAQYGGRKKYKTEENLLKGWQACIRAKTEAQELQGYIDEYGQDESANGLFYKYARLNSGDKKIWGLNFNALTDKITNLDNQGLLYPNPADPQTGLRDPLNYVMGIVRFKEENMPLYYENLAVINYFIKTYYLD
jgi:hypothetical protein